MYYILCILLVYTIYTVVNRKRITLQLAKKEKKKKKKMKKKISCHIASKSPDGAFDYRRCLSCSLDRVRLPFFRYLRAFKAISSSFSSPSSSSSTAVDDENATGKARQASSISDRARICAGRAA